MKCMKCNVEISEHGYTCDDVKSSELSDLLERRNYIFEHYLIGTGLIIADEKMTNSEKVSNLKDRQIKILDELTEIAKKIRSF